MSDQQEGGVGRDLAGGGKETVLDQVLGDVPWRHGFAVGSGIDAITGGISGSAVKAVDMIEDDTISDHEKILFIDDEEEFSREVGVALSGKFNVQPGIEASASSEYLNKVSYSSSSTTLVARYDAMYEYDKPGGVFELTDKANALILDAGKFRTVFGDYFVAAVRRGAQFIATYNLKANSSKDLNEFKASIGGESPEVFKAEVSTKFQQEASKRGIAVTVDIDMRGHRRGDNDQPTGPWSPEKVYQALNWFKANVVGVPIEAILKHYSTITPSFPRSVAVDPLAFVQLKLLYNKVWICRSIQKAIPKVYSDGLIDEFTTTISGVEANQGTLATDQALRAEYVAKVDQLLEKLRQVEARQDFFDKVRDAQKAESKQDDWVEGTKLFGFKIADSPAVRIQVQPMNYKVEGERLYKKSTTLHFSDPSKLIVGWEVIDNWSDGTNGHWSKRSPVNLLTTDGSVEVEGWEGRGTDWTVNWYYVDARDYRF